MLVLEGPSYQTIDHHSDTNLCIPTEIAEHYPTIQDIIISDNNHCS